MMPDATFGTCMWIHHSTINTAVSAITAALDRERNEPKRKTIVEFFPQWHIKVGDFVYWVHCSNRVYKGEVKRIDFCENQGAIYLILHSPTFKINPYPCVHYTHCFISKEEAHELARELKRADTTQMRCDRCKFEFKEPLRFYPTETDAERALADAGKGENT